ncbi:hypothetical protein CSUI_008563, partial [Cystoisospora suis]
MATRAGSSPYNSRGLGLSSGGGMRTSEGWIEALPIGTQAFFEAQQKKKRDLRTAGVGGGGGGFSEAEDSILLSKKIIVDRCVDITPSTRQRRRRLSPSSSSTSSSFASSCDESRETYSSPVRRKMPRDVSDRSSRYTPHRTSAMTSSSSRSHGEKTKKIRGGGRSPSPARGHEDRGRGGDGRRSTRRSKGSGGIYRKDFEDEEEEKRRRKEDRKRREQEEHLRFIRSRQAVLDRVWPPPRAKVSILGKSNGNEEDDKLPQGKKKHIDDALFLDEEYEAAADLHNAHSLDFVYQLTTSLHVRKPSPPPSPRPKVVVKPPEPSPPPPPPPKKVEEPPKP